MISNPVPRDVQGGTMDVRKEAEGGDMPFIFGSFTE